MEKSDLDISKITDFLESIAKDINLTALEDFKKTIDRDKVINESSKLLEKPTDALPTEEKQSITNIIDALLPKNDEK